MLDCSKRRSRNSAVLCFSRIRLSDRRAEPLRLYNSMGFVWTCCARKMEVRFWKCGIGRTLWTRRAIRRVVPLRTANPPPRGTESDIEFPFTTAQNLLKLEHDWADDLFQRIYGADVFGISANAGRLGKSLFLGVRSIVEFNSRERFASPPVAR